MSFWLTIEVQHGQVSAERWREGHGESLIVAAVTRGASDWQWHSPSWGVVLEVEFTEQDARDAFRSLTAVQAALDAVPDPVSGVLVYPGRGGSSGAGVPRRPRPAPAAGAATVDEPRDQLLELTKGDPELRLALAGRP